MLAMMQQRIVKSAAWLVAKVVQEFQLIWDYTILSLIWMRSLASWCGVVCQFGTESIA
jgi:hypothetical protein